MKQENNLIIQTPEERCLKIIVTTLSTILNFLSVCQICYIRGSSGTTFRFVQAIGHFFV